MSDFLRSPHPKIEYSCAATLGEQLGIIPSIVEKDFWVCRVLNILFREDFLESLSMLQRRDVPLQSVQDHTPFL